MVPAAVLPSASAAARGAATATTSRAVSPKLRSNASTLPTFHHPKLIHPTRSISGKPHSSSSPSVVATKCSAEEWQHSSDQQQLESETAQYSYSAERVVVYYFRRDGHAHQFGLHVWQDVAGETSWDAPLPATAASNGWVTYDVALAPKAKNISFIVHRRDEQCTKVLSYDVTVTTAAGRTTTRTTRTTTKKLWVVSGIGKIFTSEPDVRSMPTGVVDLKRARAVWLTRDIIAVPFGDNRVHATTQFELVASPSAGLQLNEHGGVISCHDRDGDNGVSYVRLEPPGECKPGDPSRCTPGAFDGGWAREDARAAGDKYPHIRAAGYTCLRLPADVDTRGLLKCQLAVTARRDGVLQDATSVQTHGAVDDLFGRYDGPLGAEIRPGGGGVALRVWAPTARRVTLHLFDEPSGGRAVAAAAMSEDANTGVWTAEGGADWNGKYYQYAVEVFHPWGAGAPPSGAGNVVTSYATDPYSRSLSADGERTHICDVENAPELKPPGWDHLRKPSTSLEPTDMAVYELHVRDFSAMDESVPWELRGKYGAFGARESTPVKHLAGLAAAGITHVHLLPSYDFGSVPERAHHQATVDHAYLAQCAPDSDQQQAAVAAVANSDAYNWGYDPVHYGVPEGSYASDPDGGRRVLEFRQMVADLAAVGLKTVCDVVYNHTLSAGPTDGRSVLDKVVPGYYHRRNADGYYENSTCCNNTASENLMMERLIVDDLVHWAKDYKVDGFRFDLMGHLMLRTVKRARDALGALTMERDGVDGEGIYLYGEGWDYAEVEKNRVGVNASQLNLGGTGVGSFNDRLREGIMGGSPFGDPRVQGVLTGLYFAPNGFIDQGSEDDQRKRVMEDTEKVIAAMAGNLRTYTFTNRWGNRVAGKDAAWEGSNVGYAEEPRETVNYVSAHDNETLFDGITLRSAPHVPLSVRCRLNRVAVAVVALSQGVPFFHAGDEILRSKSLDRDSYNSGDWFNRLDYTGDTHNFGVGLPGREKNGDRYPFISRLLADASLKPGKDEITQSVAHFKEVLAIRGSSPLFRLRSAAEIQRRVSFYNTGPEQVPGVIVMGVSDDEANSVGSAVDTRFRRVMVCVNVTADAVAVKDPNLARDVAGAKLALHPLQGAVAPDAAYLALAKFEGGAVTVPPYSTVVFVEHR